MIRINELARELEVKSKAVIDYLPEIGVTDKKSHSSALDDEIANKVREYFHALSEPEPVEELAATKPVPPPKVTPAVGPAPRPIAPASATTPATQAHVPPAIPSMNVEAHP